MNYDSFFFFFFQAEDGIRDLTVTGVQTCALPIFQPRLTCPRDGSQRFLAPSQDSILTAAERSEEHTSELQSQSNLVCRLLLEKKKQQIQAPRAAVARQHPHIHRDTRIAVVDPCSF